MNKLSIKIHLSGIIEQFIFLAILLYHAILYGYIVGCPLGARFLEFGVLHQKIMLIGMILEGLYLRFSHFNAFFKTGHPLDLEGKLIKIY